MIEKNSNLLPLRECWSQILTQFQSLIIELGLVLCHLGDERLQLLDVLDKDGKLVLLVDGVLGEEEMVATLRAL